MLQLLVRKHQYKHQFTFRKESHSKMESRESGKFPVVIGGQFTPHIASAIFNLLDKQELTKSRSVSSTWKDVVDSRTNLWADPELFGKAAEEGNLELCRRIIEKVDNKNPSLQDGDSPLHIAAEKGQIAICCLILDYLEDKNPQNDEGYTPLHCAASADDPVAGAEVYRLIMNEVQDKNPKDKRGTTPLHMAVFCGNFEVSKLIVESVDEKNPADEYGCTPLHEAARYGNKDIFCLIFEKVEAKNPPNSKGDTPLHWAAIYHPYPRPSQVEICRLILAHVDDKHPVNHQGQTPLDWAREELFQGEELQGLEQLWLDVEDQ